LGRTAGRCHAVFRSQIYTQNRLEDTLGETLRRGGPGHMSAGRVATPHPSNKLSGRTLKGLGYAAQKKKEFVPQTRVHRPAVNPPRGRTRGASRCYPADPPSNRWCWPFCDFIHWEAWHAVPLRLKLGFPRSARRRAHRRSRQHALRQTQHVADEQRAAAERVCASKYPFTKKSTGCYSRVETEIVLLYNRCR
jgi:hypothetical protein